LSHSLTLATTFSRTRLRTPLALASSPRRVRSRARNRRQRRLPPRRRRRRRPRAPRVSLPAPSPPPTCLLFPDDPPHLRDSPRRRRERPPPPPPRASRPIRLRDRDDDDANVVSEASRRVDAARAELAEAKIRARRELAEIESTFGAYPRPYRPSRSSLRAFLRVFHRRVRDSGAGAGGAGGVSSFIFMVD
jgi:hypothetical protein